MKYNIKKLQNALRIKFTISLLLIIAIFLVPGLSQTALASGSFRTTAGVHVRESASESAKSLTTVNMDSAVDVIEHNPAGWSKVQAGDKTGYIRSDFLKLTIGDTPAQFRTTAGVHLRESASTSAKSLTVVNTDTTVDVLEHNPAGWSKVRIGDKTGFIKSEFLKHAGTAAASSASGGSSAGGEDAVIEQRKTSGDDVNMRTGATTQAKIIKQLAKGTAVDVLADETNGWSKVKHNNDTGYIRSDFLVSSASSQGGSKTYYTTGNVNLRNAASTASGTFIRTLPVNTAVEVTGSAGDGWSKVKHNGTDGYIKSELLTDSVKGESVTRYTSGSGVRIRAKASTSSSILKTLERGTAVEVLSDSNGWSNVKHKDTTGYISSDLLSATPPGAEQVIAIMRVGDRAGANFRTGPGTSFSKVTSSALPYGTTVEVLAHGSDGWTKARHNGKIGYIFTQLLETGSPVELVTMSEITHLLPYRQNIRVVDVRTGVSFNIRIFSKGSHADMEPATREDTDAMFSTRNGVRSWAARPLWVYVGNRVFAAATHGMPHDVDFVSGNGIDGHLCLHFHNTTANSKTYQADLRNAVQEAYDKRPR